MISTDFIANSFGIMAFGGCLVAFFPTVASWSKKYLPNKKVILNLANIGLLFSIFCGLVHGLIMTQKTEIDFYNIKTYWGYGAGLFALNLLIFGALEFKEMRLDFKKLNYFTYAGLLLIVCHFIIK